MMKIREIKEILGATIWVGEEYLDQCLHAACGCDLMSDVLAFAKEKCNHNNTYHSCQTFGGTCCSVFFWQTAIRPKISPVIVEQDDNNREQPRSRKRADYNPCRGSSFAKIKFEL